MARWNASIFVWFIAATYVAAACLALYALPAEVFAFVGRALFAILLFGVAALVGGFARDIWRDTV